MIKTPAIILLLTLSLFTAIVGVLAYRHVKNGEIAGIKTEEKQEIINGIVVPHHMLAKELIDDAYQNINASGVTRVVVFSPNHFYHALPAVVMSAEITGVDVDQTMVDQLKNQFPDVLLDQKMVEQEHGVMIQIPYIKQYFPQASVVPIIISSAMTQEKIEALTRTLGDIVNPDDTLFVLSTDFSHNTTTAEGMTKNEETVAAMSSFDYAALYHFHDDHIDAPNAAVVWLSVLDSFGARNWNQWQSSHSGLITGDTGMQGTSYVTGAFYR